MKIETVALNKSLDASICHPMIFAVGELIHPQSDTIDVLGHAATGDVILGGRNINTQALSHLKRHIDCGAFSTFWGPENVSDFSLNNNSFENICLCSISTGFAITGETS